MRPVLDLVLDAAHVRRDDRAALPHRLGDGEPEALGEALLGHDVGAALQRVDDDRVLVGLVHRQQREVHAPADALRQLVPRRLDLLEDLRALGIVGHRRDVGAGEQQMRVLVGVHVLGEGRQDARRILQTIPARDLGQQRHVEAQRVLLDDARLVLDPAHAAVEALEDRPRVVVMVGGQPRGTQHGGHRGERHRVVLGRERVDRRGDDSDLGFVEPLPGVARAREDVGVGRARRSR